MSLHRLLSALAVMPGLVFGGLTVPVRAIASEVIHESSKDVVLLEASRGALIRLARPAHTVFVSDPKVADIQVKSPHLVYLLGKAPGETTLIAVDENEKVLTNRPVRVTHNLTRLRSALRSMLPSNNIDVQSVDSSIIVTGSVTTPTDAADVRRLAERLVQKPEHVIMRMGVTAPTQVQLRVRVAEVSRDVLKQFGINWDALLSSGNFMFGLATANPVAAAGTFLTRNNSTNSIFGGFSTGTLDINGLIDAMDDEGLITVLAEPNLTSMSGKPATFLAGGEFPIIVPDDNRVTVEFKQFGVSLGFTPTLLGSNRISLHVNPEVSQLSNTGAVEVSGFAIPALTTRRAETTVELGNGQSFAIAGLLQNDIRHDINKFPGLGDVPVLGTLFRSDRFQRNETELVIIVTPYIVRPTSNPVMAAPTDGMTPPTDKDRILHGQLYRPTQRAADAAPVTTSGTSTRGPIGFVLE